MDVDSRAWGKGAERLFARWNTFIQPDSILDS
jgi:hypothetical protein